MQQIEQENVVETQAENSESKEEMSYSEMFSDMLGELIPGRGRLVTCWVILLFFLLLTLVLWSSFGWQFYQKGPTNGDATLAGMADIITPDRIRLLHRLPNGSVSSELPSWIHDDLKSMIAQSLKAQHHNSIYDNDQISVLLHSLKEIYWVKETVAIRKYYPAHLEIEVKYRKPVLLISTLIEEGTEENSESRKQYIPVSEDCRILPMDMERFPIPHKEVDTFPAFAGIAPIAFINSDKPMDIVEFEGYSRPLSEVEGIRWEDGTSNVENAVAIVNLLGERWERFQLDYICIEKIVADVPEFCIVLKSGSRIHWGTNNINSTEKEILDVEKIKMLDEMYEQNAPIFAKPEEICQIGFRRPNMLEKQTDSADAIETIPTEEAFEVQEP